MKPRPAACARLAAAVSLVASLVLPPGCASFRSDIRGRYIPPASGVSKETRPPVKLLFLFRHYQFREGLDAVPKLVDPGVTPVDVDALGLPAGIGDFANIFEDALGEIRNLEAYATYTESSADTSIPERIELRSKLEADADCTVELVFMERSRFVPQFIAGVVSICTLTVIPAWYTWEYSLTARVYDHAGNVTGTYERSADLRDWVQLLLILVYPFHPRERKIEEIYVEFLHDVFRQMDAEGVLMPAPAPAPTTTTTEGS